ncbi:BspA family leucine-rich repeat surface protein [Mycoplasma cottewii]|uniref:BspA family leucine-rich repeat surface protein n=1 Tax=Mycoplasma cottewii TaxID=51364 RepID=A0ABY5TVX5_9MOLU|nr:BspA family leucine-rich repeat surface protein [Mycoplasma cottewii]UWD34802.1 BspA family leucine-rich repeat surface protein [Mycoplasma cottewii]
MKILKLITLVSVLIPTALTASSVISHRFNEKNDHFISDQSNEKSENEILTSLNKHINDLRIKIIEIQGKINALKDEKQKVEKQKFEIDQQIRTIKEEFESSGSNESLKEKLDALLKESDKLNNRPRDIDDELATLQRDKEGFERQKSDNESKLETFRKNEEAYRLMVLHIWNSRFKNTIWEKETCFSLLQRFEKETGIRLELQDLRIKDDPIHINNKKFNNNLKVKTFNIRFDLPSNAAYKLSQDKIENGDELVQFGYDDKGKIQPISPNINKVPITLPWFITDLSRAFYKTNHGEIDGIQHWDTSNVTNMSHMFFESWINQQIGHWNVKNVMNFEWMFWSCTLFEKSIGSWEISSNAKTERFMNNPVPIWSNGAMREACVPKIIRERHVNDARHIK